MMLIIIKRIICAVSILLLIVSCSQKKGKNKYEYKISKDEQMEWWRDAKFGMFIHWGLYAVPVNSSEWHVRTYIGPNLEVMNIGIKLSNTPRQWKV